MNNPGSLPSIIYLEFLFLLLGLAASAALYWLITKSVQILYPSKEKPSALFLSRLSLPAAFLAVFLVFKIQPLREALFPSRKLWMFFDAALLLIALFLVIRILDAFWRIWYVRRKMPFPVPGVLHNLILAILYLGLFFAVLKNILHVNITPFLATSAILTMILGLALQGVLSNVLSGISLHFTRSFSKGEWVEIVQTQGVVIDTSWRETRVLDRNSNVVVIPNNTAASEKIINFSRPDKKTALTFPVKAGYNASPSLVFEALCEAAADVPEILKNPAPFVYITGYEDFGVSYVLKFWITDFSRKNPIFGEVGRRTWYHFRQRGIEIPLPMGDKLHETLLALTKEHVPGAEEESMKNYLDLLNSSFLRYEEGEKAGELIVSEKEVQELASRIRRYRYASGETLFRQGERGETCYVIARGAVRGEIVYEEKEKRFTSEFRVGRGGIFGEMSLFTGMLRTATGTIEVESELLEIRASDFARLLERKPEVAEVIAGLVSERNRKNQDFLKKIKELSAEDIRMSTNKRSILNRLLRFIKH